MFRQMLGVIMWSTFTFIPSHRPPGPLYALFSKRHDSLDLTRHKLLPAQQVSRTDDFEDRNIGASAQYSHIKRTTGMRQSWSPEISQADMAFAWSKCLAPVYAFNLIGIRAALKYKVY